MGRLDSNINVLNTGLGFFEIHAVINEKQLEFYDKNNNLLHTEELNKLENISIDFNDKFNNSISYSYSVGGENSCDRHVFIYNRDEDNNYKIEFYSKDDKSKSIEIRLNNRKEEFINKRFDIGKDFIDVEINSIHGHRGNNVDSIERRLWYTTPTHYPYPLLFMTEATWLNGGNFLTGNDKGIEVSKSNFYETIITPLTDKRFEELSTLIACHPRNKELIEFVINKIGNDLPILKDFIVNNFSIYSHIMDKKYEKNTLVDLLVDSTINDKCDIKKENELVLK